MTDAKPSDRSSRVRSSRADRIYYAVSGVLLGVLLILVAYPILFVLSASFSSGSAVATGKVLLWPVEFSLEGAWISRIAGCLLGKPPEGFKRCQVQAVLQHTGNRPLSRYIAWSALPEDLPGLRAWTLSGLKIVSGSTV